MRIERIEAAMYWGILLLYILLIIPAEGYAIPCDAPTQQGAEWISVREDRLCTPEMEGAAYYHWHKLGVDTPLAITPDNFIRVPCYGRVLKEAYTVRVEDTLGRMSEHSLPSEPVNCAPGLNLDGDGVFSAGDIGVVIKLYTGEWKIPR